MWTPEVEEALHTKQYWNILIEAQTAISFMNEAHESYRPLGGDFWLSLPTLGKLTKLFTFWSNHHPLPTLPPLPLPRPPRGFTMIGALVLDTPSHQRRMHFAWFLELKIY